jgi:hypothetical protein
MAAGNECWLKRIPTWHSGWRERGMLRSMSQTTDLRADLQRTHEALNDLAALVWRDTLPYRGCERAVEVLRENFRKHGLPLTAAFSDGSTYDRATAAERT